MSTGPHRPPRFWALVAGWLIRGEDAPFIRDDLVDSFHLDLEHGLSPRRARSRYAMNVIGSIVSLMMGWLSRALGRGAGLDVRLGIRMLGKQPLLTGVAMLALGLGIPSSLSMHHLVNVLLTPLPVPEGERVLGIRNWDRESSDPVQSTLDELQNWQESLSSFQSIGATRSYMVNVHNGDAGAPPVRAAEVTASTFPLLRSIPLLGRTLLSVDETPGAPYVAVISEDLWRSRFAADPDIVGRQVTIGRKTHTVVGVMPSTFRFPMDDRVWLPLRPRWTGPDGPGGVRVWVFGRLADGAGEADARTEVSGVTRRWAVEDPESYDRLIGEAVPMPLLLLGEDDFTHSGPAGLADEEVLLGQAILTLMLLLVCGNVGTLILARTATRSGEIAIRTALGASRSRIVFQLFVEATVLAVVATGLGLIVAEATARWLTSLLGPFVGFPSWLDITLNLEIVATAMAFAVVSAGVAGVIPALKATSRGVQGNLQRTAAGNSSIRFGAGSTVLIVSEVVLAVGFLALGGALSRSLFRDTEGQLGFDPEQYLEATVRVPDPALTADTEPLESDTVSAVRLREIQTDVLRRLQEEPGVVAASMGPEVPGASLRGSPIILETTDTVRRMGPTGLERAAEARVDVGFFSALGRPILVGRNFSEADLDANERGHRSAVIVNTTFVDHILDGRQPVGQRFRPFRYSDADSVVVDWYEIIGVVGPFGMNVHNPAKDAGVYYPVAPGEANPTRYLIEAAGSPEAFSSRLREIVAAVDPEALVVRSVSAAELIRAEGNLFRWAALMQVALAGVAFLLSVTGLYALMAFTVTQRTREIGIRTALGARPWTIISTIAKRAALQLGIGLSLGAVWGWMLLRGMGGDDAMMVDLDIPVTIAVTVTIGGVVGVLACAAPTLRGLRIQPSEALRES